jgi:hypothetical protein
MQMPSNFKPEYIDPAGKEAISFKPPILFRNVTARVYPLKANMARLRRNSAINISTWTSRPKLSNSPRRCRMFISWR